MIELCRVPVLFSEIPISTILYCYHFKLQTILTGELWRLYITGQSIHHVTQSILSFGFESQWLIPPNTILFIDGQTEGAK